MTKPSYWPEFDLYSEALEFRTRSVSVRSTGFEVIQGGS